MFLVITPEKNVPNEPEIVNTLFEKGLEVLHLRKPFFTINEYITYLNSIKKVYHSRIMIHEAHELCEQFLLKGVHLQEQFRRDLKKELKNYVDSFKHHTQKFAVSSSFHHPKDIKKNAIAFDYYLLSPVFNAISKSGYHGKGFNVNNIEAYIIGMGGVTNETIPELFSLGYQGAGVLGGIWNAKDPIKAFEILKKEYDLYCVKK